MASSSTLQGRNSAIDSMRLQTPSLEAISFNQLRESCFIDTEESMNINILEHRENDDTFLVLLQALNENPTLKSWNFNGVIWSTHEVEELCNVVKRSSSLKRLSFQQSNLNPNGIKMLAEMLKKNSVIKELSFFKCDIRETGASAIASALKTNKCLEELQIWEDSIRSEGAKELAKMIKVNSSLRRLLVSDMHSIRTSSMVSATLGRNRNLELRIWNIEIQGKPSKVVELIPSDKVLRIYRIDTSGSYKISCALARNNTIENMDISGNHINSKCAEMFKRVLQENRSLKHLNMSNTDMSAKSVSHIASALFSNHTLQSLQLERNSMGRDGIEHLLCPLSTFNPGQQQANTSLKSLSIGGPENKMGSYGVSALVQMISTNRSLREFAINDDDSMGAADFVKILVALKSNTALKSLSLKGCKGVAGDAVLEEIMNTLQVNRWLEIIDLNGTPLQRSGKTDPVHQRLRQNASAEPQIDFLKDMPMTVPKTARVFLCGQEFAGKTTLCNSILQIFARAKIPSVDQIETLVNPVEPITRTQGIKIKVLEDDDTRISIWDLAGQRELHASHHLMFPGQGSPSFFLIICSLFRKPENRQPKKHQELEEDLVYWLRFIVSNSRRAESFPTHVTVVFTHMDKTSESSELYLSAVQCVDRLRDRFTSFVELSPTVYTVDARSFGSVTKVAHHVKQTAKTILERVPKIYQVSDDLRVLLFNWKSEHSNKPVMRWEEFAQLCQKVPALRIQSDVNDPEIIKKERRPVACSLHGAGEIIYFQGLDFIIVNCEWFCEEVLGRLVRLNSKNQPTLDAQQRGFTTRKELEVILRESLQGSVPGFGPRDFENVHPSDLVSMMLEMELCYEQDPGKPDSKLFIPAILKGGPYDPQKWQLGRSDYIYTGHHFEYDDDSNHTFLTHGFFPRLQMCLYNKISRSGNGQSAIYKLEENLISILINGIDIRVELVGEKGYYIDILACSSQDLNGTLKDLNRVVIQRIRNFCASFAGCQGVPLVEGILRPHCVQELLKPSYRKGQFVLVEDLKQELLSVPADGIYNYQHTWSDVAEGSSIIVRAGFDYARDLIGEKDFRNVLNRRSHDLDRLAGELDVPSANNIPNSQSAHDDDDRSVSPTTNGIAKGVERVLERLKIIERDLQDIKQEIQGLRYYEHNLLMELHRKLNNLMNFSVQREERKVPRMFYFVRSKSGFGKRLVTNIVSGMTALQLHLLCEYRHELHVVDDQPGCNLLKVSNQTVQCILPYLNGLMKMLTFALKVGAHVVAGMGEMIPDLSKEVAQLEESSLGANIVAGMGEMIPYLSTEVAKLGESPSLSAGAVAINSDVNQFRTAQQWLVDFLKSQGCLNGKAIAQKFGLWRVRYTDDGQIDWVCNRHKASGIRNNEVMEIPID